MNIPKAYVGGFLKTAKMPRMLFILYITNIFTALLLALPFMGVLKNSMGQSRVVENLIENFDFTTFSNLMYYDGHSIFAILGGIKWLMLAYFLISVFLSGGIISTYNKDSFTTSNFFGAAAYNFFRFLGLNLIVLVVQFIFFLAVYIPLLSILSSVQATMESENTLYYIAISGFALHVLIFLIISMISDYAKYYLVLDNSFNFLKGFWKGVKYVFGHFLKTFLLNIFLLFIPAVIMYVYLYLEKDIKMATGIGILIVFLMQQAFIFLRCFLRAWVLGSQYQMYAYDFALTDPVQSVILKVFDQKTTKKVEAKTKDQKVETAEQKQASNYAIDFNSTFSSKNEVKLDNHNDSEGSTVTEQELLNKIGDQKTTVENKTVVNDQKTNVNTVPPIDDEAQIEKKTPPVIIDKDQNVKTTPPSIDNEGQIEKKTPPIITDKDQNVKVTPPIDDEAQIEKKTPPIIVDKDQNIKTTPPSIDDEAQLEEKKNDNIQSDKTIVNQSQEQVIDDKKIDELHSELKESTLNQIQEQVVNTKIEEKKNDNIQSNLVQEKIVDNKTEEKKTEDNQSNQTGNALNQSQEQVVDSNTGNKIYSAGQTVEFDEEKLIEQKMTDKLSDQGSSEELSGNQVEQQMTGNVLSSENTGELSDEQLEQKMTNNLLNSESGEVSDDQIEQKMTQNMLNKDGYDEVSDNEVEQKLMESINNDGEKLSENELENHDIDSEATFSDVGGEENSISGNQLNLDEFDHHVFETVEQNVLHLTKSTDNKTVVKKTEDTKNSNDMIEFEL